MTDTTLTFILNGRFPVDDPSLERISNIVTDKIAETFQTDVVATISNHTHIYRCGDTIATQADLALLPVGSWIGVERGNFFWPYENIGAGDWKSPDSGLFDVDWLPATVLYTPNPPSETRDGQENDCTHQSSTGIDSTPISDPAKVWRCDHCGLTWQAGHAPYDRPSSPPLGTWQTRPTEPLPANVVAAVRRAHAEGSYHLSELLDIYGKEER